MTNSPILQEETTPDEPVILADMPLEERQEISLQGGYVGDQSLERTCNLNYDYLNREGISLQAYNDILEAVAGECTEDQPHAIERSDGTLELFELTRTRDATSPNYDMWVRRGTPNIPEEMWFRGGFGEDELINARRGVFNDAYSSELGTSRAEQILNRLRYTETGSKIIQEKAQLHSEDPSIDLVEEPTGPTPTELARQQEEQRIEEMVAQFKTDVGYIIENAPRAMRRSSKRDDTDYKSVVGDIVVPNILKQDKLFPFTISETTPKGKPKETSILTGAHLFMKLIDGSNTFTDGRGDPSSSYDVEKIFKVVQIVKEQVTAKRRGGFLTRLVKRAG